MKPIWLEFWKDVRVWAISGAIIGNGLLSLFGTYHGNEWMPVAFIAGGLVLFFVTEYIIHRFLLHGFLSVILPQARRGHDEHHHEPANLKYMLTPNQYNIPYHFALTLIFSLIFWNWKLGGCLMLGFSLYQLYYEWCHFVSHRPIVPVTPWGKWMKKHHLLHHYKDDAQYYGVTHPLWDFALKTTGTGKDPQQPQKRDRSASM